ncbi:MAG: NACHT domain-containing protein, partial [Candidatus Firestonebacteria bacterium]|nr:NACHT domain-containing protein [Candidatus Firestonebacteria bacterium]
MHLRFQIFRINKLIKVDSKRFRTLFNYRINNPEACINELKRYQKQGVPFVIEGIENRAMQNFLNKHWKEEYGELWIQGWGLHPSEPWMKWLTPLDSDLETPKSFIITNAPEGPTLQLHLVKEVQKILNQFNIQFKYLHQKNKVIILKIKFPDGLEKRLGIIEEFYGINTFDEELYNQLQLWDIVVSEKKAGLKLNFCNINDLSNKIKTLVKLPECLKNIQNDKYNELYDCHNRVFYGSQQNWESNAQDSKIDDIKKIEKDGIQALFQWLENDKEPYCAILGDYGIGKTFLCRMFAHKLSETRKQKPELPFPFYIDMRHINTFIDNRIPTVSEMIGIVLKMNGINDIEPASIVELIGRGDIVIIFDGLDEKTVHLTTAQANILIEQIQLILPDKEVIKTQGDKNDNLNAQNTYKGKLLIACRTHYFRDLRQEENMLTGGRRTGGRALDFLIYYLKPFNENQIKLYLEKVFEDKRKDEAWELIKRIHNLLDLAERPYLLSLITEHLVDLKEKADKGQMINASTLYEEIIYKWLGRDQGKHTVHERHKPMFMEE